MLSKYYQMITMFGNIKYCTNTLNKIHLVIILLPNFLLSAK